MSYSKIIYEKGKKKGSLGIQFRRTSDISLHNAIHQERPTNHASNARHHLISIEKVQGVKSKIHPQNILSCLWHTYNVGTVPI